MKRYLPLPMLAILLLLGALAAQATVVSAATPRPTFSTFDLRQPVEVDEEGEEEADEDELAFEECEAEDFGFEFDEEEEGEEELTEAEEDELEEDCEEGASRKDGKSSPFVTAPVACHVSRAASTITALPAAGQVRLTVRYRTWAPTPVAVGLKLRDGKGTVGIEQTTEHLKGSGVLHLTSDLGSAVMKRALSASEFDVSLLAPKSPGYCAAELEQQLHSVKHPSADAPRVYSGRDS